MPLALTRVPVLPRRDLPLVLLLEEAAVAQKAGAAEVEEGPHLLGKGVLWRSASSLVDDSLSFYEKAKESNQQMLGGR